MSRVTAELRTGCSDKYERKKTESLVMEGAKSFQFTDQSPLSATLLARNVKTDMDTSQKADGT